ncbi:alpha/beta fold hydrolase [Methylibium petroleiphilum]|uniref:2-hydroxymuconic semialdehyde hydrolase n=1 Tax=Methylibium petroleiphilum (strain ATCC BAA-1232 / LMG 22953 / PM1) TaxID=420662 RepID=A2SI41_METPP|nr:alpha/beta fold hydrolase [Methylibium petroleiphilum]ABM95230.1 2-hydroxymuconic semialdehyde hydrolase [Methylibium petroleiphilum PM1]
MSSANPEIGKKVRTGGFDSNVHDQGASAPGQPPVLFVHGSGPGVSAWANWRLVLPRLATQRRVVAPDMLGFGYTDRPQPADQSGVYTMDAWVQQAVDLLDALDIAQADLVGNSFGGALSLALAIRHPQRVRRLVLMGSVGVRFPITPGLDAVWGYTPSFENMRGIMDVFAHDRRLVNDELAKLRYEASIRPGFQESFGAMFPAPRQRWVDALASPEAAIRALPHSTLVIHGRDDQVIPMSTSLTLAQWIPDAQLHLFGRCGHWTQIEHTERFVRLVGDFLAEADAAASATP